MHIVLKYVVVLIYCFIYYLAKIKCGLYRRKECVPCSFPTETFIHISIFDKNINFLSKYIYQFLYLNIIRNNAQPRYLKGFFFYCNVITPLLQQDVGCNFVFISVTYFDILYHFVYVTHTICVFW